VQHHTAKRYDEALAKFRESYGIVASPNSRLMIVRVLNEAGRGLEAYREANEAMKEAADAAAKAPDKYQQAVDALNREIEAAKMKIGLLTVTVQGASEGASVTVAGQAVPASEWGKPIALEPGEVEVTLDAPEGKDQEKVTLEAGTVATVTLSPPPPKAAPPPPPPKPVKQEESGYRGPDRRMMAYIAGGVGVLGFLGFGTFGLLSNGRFDRIESACPDPDNCDPALEDDADTGRTYQIVANVGLVVGIVGIAAGTGLFVWDVLDPASEEQAQVFIGPGGASVRASF
jgi:hypothetical protein